MIRSTEYSGALRREPLPRTHDSAPAHARNINMYSYRTLSKTEGIVALRIDWDLMHVHYQVIVVCIVYRSKVMIYLNLGYGRSPGS